MEDVQNAHEADAIELTDELRMALRNLLTPYYSDIEKVREQIRAENDKKGKNLIQEHDEYIKNLDYYYFILKGIKNKSKRISFEYEIDEKIEEFILYIRDNIEPSEQLKQIFDKILIENDVGEKHREFSNITNSILRVHRNKRNRFIFKDFPPSIAAQKANIYQYLSQFGIDKFIIAEKDIPIEFRAAYEDFAYEKAYLDADIITLRELISKGVTIEGIIPKEIDNLREKWLNCMKQRNVTESEYFKKKNERGSIISAIWQDGFKGVFSLETQFIEIEMYLKTVFEEKLGKSKEEIEQAFEKMDKDYERAGNVQNWILGLKENSPMLSMLREFADINQKLLDQNRPQENMEYKKALAEFITQSIKLAKKLLDKYKEKYKDKYKETEFYKYYVHLFKGCAAFLNNDGKQLIEDKKGNYTFKKESKLEDIELRILPIVKQDLEMMLCLFNNVKKRNIFRADRFFDTKRGCVAKAPERLISQTYHVGSGSKDLASPFLSATLDLEIATGYMYKYNGNDRIWEAISSTRAPVVMIDIFDIFKKVNERKRYINKQGNVFLPGELQTLEICEAKLNEELRKTVDISKIEQINVALGKIRVRINDIKARNISLYERDRTLPEGIYNLSSRKEIETNLMYMDKEYDEKKYSGELNYSPASSEILFRNIIDAKYSLQIPPIILDLLQCLNINLSNYSNDKVEAICDLSSNIMELMLGTESTLTNSEKEFLINYYGSEPLALSDIMDIIYGKIDENEKIQIAERFDFQMRNSIMEKILRNSVISDKLINIIGNIPLSEIGSDAYSSVIPIITSKTAMSGDLGEDIVRRLGSGVKLHYSKDVFVPVDIPDFPVAIKKKDIYSATTAAEDLRQTYTRTVHREQGQSQEKS